MGMESLESLPQETAMQEAKRLTKEIATISESSGKSFWSLLKEGFSTLTSADTQTPEGKQNFIQGLGDLFTGVMNVFGWVKRDPAAVWKQSNPKKFNPDELVPAYEQTLARMNELHEGKEEKEVNPVHAAEMCYLASGYLKEWYSREADDSPIHDGEVAELMAAQGKIQPGDVILLDTRNNTFRDNIKRSLIQGTTGTWTHVMIVTQVDPTLKLVHSTGETGVVEVSWKEYCAERPSIDFVVCNTPAKYEDGIANFARKQVGKKYDAIGVLSDSSSGGRVSNQNDAWYCSEIWFEAAKEAGRPIRNELFSPTDILKLVRPVFAGQFNGMQEYGSTKRG